MLACGRVRKTHMNIRQVLHLHLDFITIPLSSKQASLGRWCTKQPVCCQTGVRRLTGTRCGSRRRHTVCQPNGHQATQEHFLVDGNVWDSLNLWDGRMRLQEVNLSDVGPIPERQSSPPAAQRSTWFSSSSTWCSSSASTHRTAGGISSTKS